MNHKSKITLGVIAALSILVVVLTACSPASPVSAAAENRYGQPGGRGGQPAPQTGSGSTEPLQSPNGFGQSNTAPQTGTGSTETWQGRGGFGQGNVAPQTGTGSTETRQGRGGFGQGNVAPQTGTGTTLSPLSDAEKDALTKAIAEEYGALNLYNSIIAQFGSVYPFDMIARSEQQHVNALLRQAEKYNLVVPANSTTVSPSNYASLADACAAGAAAEIADAALYDTLKPVTQRADLLQVFNSLQSASLNSHLPAFEACK